MLSSPIYVHVAILRCFFAWAVTPNAWCLPSFVSPSSFTVLLLWCFLQNCMYYGMFLRVGQNSIILLATLWWIVAEWRNGDIVKEMYDSLSLFPSPPLCVHMPTSPYERHLPLTHSVWMTMKEQWKHSVLRLPELSARLSILAKCCGMWLMQSFHI